MSCICGNDRRRVSDGGTGSDVLLRVPGSKRTSFSGLKKYMTENKKLFEQEWEKAGHNVFRINNGLSTIVLMDYTAAQCLWDEELIEKEPYFGPVEVNMELLKNVLPSCAVNGKEHARKKGLALLLMTNYLAPNFLSTSTKHIETDLRENIDAWKNDIEDTLFRLLSESVLEAALGSQVSYQQFLHFKGNCFQARKSARLLGIYPKSKKGRIDELISLIRTSNTFQDSRFMLSCQEQGIFDPEEIAIQVAFLLNFNVLGGSASVVANSLTRFSCLREEDKSRLRTEVNAALKNHGGKLTDKCLGELELLESFIYEVLRLNPTVSSIYGVAKKSFNVQSKTGSYLIEQKDLLMVNLSLLHRDPQEFPDPETFSIDRFMDKELRNRLLTFAGPAPSTLANHRCPGEALAVYMTKIFLVYLLHFCEWELMETPIYSFMHKTRHCMADRKPTLKFFECSMGEESLRETPHADHPSSGCPFHENNEKGKDAQGSNSSMANIDI